MPTMILQGVLLNDGKRTNVVQLYNDSHKLNLLMNTVTVKVKKIKAD